VNKTAIIIYIVIGCTLIIVAGLLSEPRVIRSSPAKIKTGGKAPSAVIPTATAEPPVLDFELTWQAICQQESSNRPDAVNESEQAWGIAQIRPIMVADVNRILGRQIYSHDDAFSPSKARQMFEIYQNHYYPQGNPEIWSRAWAGGPKGPYNSCTLNYWKDIEKILNSLDTE